MKPSSPAGWHLTVDGICRGASRLADVEGLKGLLADFVDRLGMEILDGPHMTSVVLDPTLVEEDRDEGGITGYVLITTSHISIHTWPLRERFCLDIFSCRQFDRDAALAFLRERLDVKEDRVHWLVREWPEAGRDELAVASDFTGVAG